jgi:hypothetical protein
MATMTEPMPSAKPTMMRKARKSSSPWLASAMAPPSVGTDAGAPDRAEEEAAEELALPALRLDPAHPRIRPRRHARRRQREAGGELRHQHHEAEGDHQDRARLRHHLLVEAHEVPGGDHAETHRDEGRAHARGKRQRSPAARLKRAREDDGQDRQDAGIDQRQKARAICEKEFHAPSMRDGGHSVIKRPRERAVRSA